MIDSLCQRAALQPPHRLAQTPSRLIPRWNHRPGSRLIPRWTRLPLVNAQGAFQNAHAIRTFQTTQKRRATAMLRLDYLESSRSLAEVCCGMNARAAVQYVFPDSKDRLPVSAKALASWRKVVPINQHPPTPLALALCLTKHFLVKRDPRRATRSVPAHGKHSYSVHIAGSEVPFELDNHNMRRSVTTVNCFTRCRNP